MSEKGNCQVTTRGRGRPKGLPKTGGRRPASELPVELRQFVNQRGRPLEFLAAVASGRKVSVADPANPGQKLRVYPTMEQRAAASRVLLAKMLPDLKSVETTGNSGQQLNVIFDRGDAGLLGEDVHKAKDDVELARRLAFLLTQGTIAQDRLEEAGLSHLLDGGDKGLLGDAPVEVPEEAVEVLPEVGTEEHEGGHVLRLAERLEDGRERWEGRDGSGQLVATTFGRQALSARLRAAQGR